MDVQNKSPDHEDDHGNASTEVAQPGINDLEADNNADHHHSTTSESEVNSGSTQSCDQTNNPFTINQTEQYELEEKTELALSVSGDKMDLVVSAEDGNQTISNEEEYHKAPVNIKVEKPDSVAFCSSKMNKYHDFQTVQDVGEKVNPDMVCDTAEVMIINSDKDIPVYRVDSSSEDSDSDSSSSDDVSSVLEESEEDEDGGSKGNKNKGAKVTQEVIKTKGELHPQDLPPIDDLMITVSEDIEMKEIGKIQNIVGTLVVVQQHPNLPALNHDTILFLEGRKVFGQVFEVFGPVPCPLYAVRFNTTQDIEAKRVAPGLPVYCAPKQEEWTHYVFMEQLRRLKGSDASWEHNNEPPAKFLDYSDDEQERLARRKNRPKGSDKESSDEEEEKQDTGKKRRRQKKKFNRDAKGKSGTQFSRNDSNQGAQQFHPRNDRHQPRQGPPPRWPPSQWNANPSGQPRSAGPWGPQGWMPTPGMWNQGQFGQYLPSDGSVRPPPFPPGPPRIKGMYTAARPLNQPFSGPRGSPFSGGPHRAPPPGIRPPVFQPGQYIQGPPLSGPQNNYPNVAPSMQNIGPPGPNMPTQAQYMPQMNGAHSNHQGIPVSQPPQFVDTRHVQNQNSGV